jgi:signal recognition particle subunit SEC65
MVEDYGEEFSEEPCVEDFLRQLEFSLERLDQHASKNVIYERCPLDFLAYLNALDANVSEALLKRISEAMRQLDLIVYLPLEQEGGGEYPKLRRAMDRQLSEILSSTNLAVVEATGPTSQRLRAVENALMDIKHAAG